MYALEQYRYKVITATSTHVSVELYLTRFAADEAATKYCDSLPIDQLPARVQIVPIQVEAKTGLPVLRSQR